ncbi:putative Aldehyde dehydrogenase family [Trypanosoma vivax]|uniref:Aldehyde dehydrogenase domain-containing protein n=1 Tax=Trypanosoma vivax (strain Y486) TaxID=1055687 RepID=G0TZS5_TRYVY|nr:hypothetical protein TRVL_04383 [Trypanosoma vivax]KAH8611001.1 putative Aldehyde dehydrogenase family [Trypanosoma vivax]CCC50103.1 conserved hypothetical protein [Trypanosoma vivax Y486]
MCGVGVVTRTLPFRVAWRHSYKSLLPPLNSAYVCGRLHTYCRCDTELGDNTRSSRRCSSGVPIVLESPSDSTGLFTLTVSTTDGAASALREVMRFARPLTLVARDTALARLSTVLEGNEGLLASSEALATGMCLQDARQSMKECISFVAACRNLLSSRGPCNGEDVSGGKNSILSLLESLGCCMHSWVPGGGGSGRSGVHGNNFVTLCYTGANYPLQRGVEAICAALVRGSSAVWFPSLENPLSALWLMHLLYSTNRGSGSGYGDNATKTDGSAYSKEPIHIVLYRSEHGRFLTDSFCEKSLCNGSEIVGVSNGLTGYEKSCLFPFLRNTHGVADAPRFCSWSHRVCKPAVAIVSGDVVADTVPLGPLDRANVIKTKRLAERIFHDAFKCNGRTLSPLHAAFVPHDVVLQVLRDLSDCIRSMRLGHSLDPTSGHGPLPSSAHLLAVKETIEKAVSISDGGFSFQQVCGGFEVVMPAGFFVLPCVLYGSLARTESASESPYALLTMCKRVQCVREELDRVGGGPVVVVCGYDARHYGQHLAMLEEHLCVAGHYVVHRW